MKKLLVCAMAAIVALASCTKTQVINNEPLKEIGFRAVAGASTKAEQTTDNFSQTLGVLAYVNGTTESVYFGNTSFSKKSDDQWGAGMYWPITNALDFVVYSPYVEGGAKFDYATKKLTVTADNSSFNSNGEGWGDDYLYGSEYLSNKTYTEDTDGTPQAVAVLLNHAMAKVTVNFEVENVKVTNVKFDTPYRKGSYDVTYGVNGTTVDWTPDTAVPDAIEVIEEIDGTSAEATESTYILLVPETVSNITFNYQIKGTQATLTKTIEVTDEWAAGTHYVYNISVTPKEIKFQPSVSNEWDTKIL